MIWLISQIVNPYVMERDINRMSVEIYNDNWHSCQTCIDELILYIKNSLGNNLTFIKYDDFKKAIYMKLQNYSSDDSLKVVKVLEEKGVNNYVVRH